MKIKNIKELKGPLKKYISIITKVGGSILLLTGLAILTNQLQVVGFFILEYFPVFENIG